MVAVLVHRNIHCVSLRSSPRLAFHPKYQVYIFIINMDTQVVYQKIYKVIKNARRVLFVSHKNPDFDTIGSTCAIGSWARREGVQCDFFCADVVSRNLLFLPPAAEYIGRANLRFDAFDVVCVLDCGDVKRTGIQDEILSRSKGCVFINIDHHLGTEPAADLEIKDSQIKATAILVYDFFVANNLRPTALEAECLLTGMLFDTGNLAFQGVRPTDFLIASELVRLGANWTRVNKNLERIRSVKPLNVFGTAILHAKFDAQKRIVSGFVRESEFEAGIADEVEGVPNFLASLREADFSLFFREKNGEIRASVRTMKSGLDVSRLAGLVGGGGHKKAAGFMVRGRVCEDGDRLTIIPE